MDYVEPIIHGLLVLFFWCLLGFIFNHTKKKIDTINNIKYAFSKVYNKAETFLYPEEEDEVDDKEGNYKYIGNPKTHIKLEKSIKDLKKLVKTHKSLLKIKMDSIDIIIDNAENIVSSFGLDQVYYDKPHKDYYELIGYELIYDVTEDFWECQEKLSEMDEEIKKIKPIKLYLTQLVRY